MARRERRRPPTWVPQARRLRETPFSGNCAIGGTWYTGTAFPAQYQNSYFFADWGEGVIKNLTFDQNDRPLALGDFLSNGGAVVCIVQHPFDGSLYYVSYTFGDSGTVRKLSYAGNRNPVAVASADKYYGAGRLTVQFSSSGSSDPDGQPITYSWNFGDGSPVSTQANPSHTFSAPGGVPTKFTVTLTVTGEVGRRYAVETSGDLVFWTQVGVQKNTSSSMVFSDPPTGHAIRFYRVVSMPRLPGNNQ